MTEEAPKKLEWGQTPWDSLSREELLREVQRMYATLVAANTTMQLSKMNASPGVASFWESRQGTGACALEMARQILEPLHEKYEPENIYRAFFRIAVDLLFPDHSRADIGHGWVICSKCGNGIGGVGRDTPSTEPGSQPWHHDPPDCDGEFRPLEWSDLVPKVESGE